MENSGPLVPLGLAIIALSLGAIVIPYLRGKSDALTAWNLMLLGGVVFTGLGCLEVAYGFFHWPELQWFQPTRQEVTKFILYTVLFYATIFLTYYVFKWPRRLVAPFFNKWPRASDGWEFASIAMCLVLTAMTFVFGGVPILNSLFFNISHKAAVFAVVVSFSYWYRHRLNPVVLALFLGVFGYALLFSMVTFVGRRLLLSVAVSPLFCLYWLGWRYRSPKRNLLRLGIAGTVAFGVAAFYSSFRHYSYTSVTHERSFASIMEKLRESSPEEIITVVSRDWLHYLSQYTVHYSLLTIHLVDSGQMEVQPLNTLAFVATYPIPRLLFPGKPAPTGIHIVTEVLRLPYITNWGLGIVGHAYNDGGIAVVILYGVLLVIMVRLLDDALARQPSNVYLISVLAITSPHFVSMIRGDPANMTAEILEAFFFAWGLSLLGRILVGTATPTRSPIPDNGARSPASRQFVHLRS